MRYDLWHHLIMSNEASFHTAWVVSGLLVNADIELVYRTSADSRQHASCCDLIRDGDIDGMHKGN